MNSKQHKREFSYSKTIIVFRATTLSQESARELLLQIHIMQHWTATISTSAEALILFSLFIQMEINLRCGILAEVILKKFEGEHIFQQSWSPIQEVGYFK